MRKLVLSVLFVCITLPVICQKEWSNWYAHSNSLLTFKNGYAEKVTNFIGAIPPVPPFENIFHFGHWGRGGISYSDPITGDLKFIISQRLGYNKNFKDFPNEAFLSSCPDQSSYRIIPFSNDVNKFYVIQFQSAFADLLAAETGLQVRCPNAVGLAYSIVDMTLDGGLGDFSSVNNRITGGLTEQITTIKHANGKDVWIVVHPYNTAEFHSILVTDGGIQSPVISTIGPMVSGGSGTIEGALTASPDGKIIAGCRSLELASGSEGDVDLFDFDKATGRLSNYRLLPNKGHSVKLQFSPDNSKLYCMGFDENYIHSLITQWDFNKPDVAGSKTIVLDILHSNMWDMQLAPDGKIYVSSFAETIGNDYLIYLMAIQCPNLPQYACNVNKRAIAIDDAAFPALINDFINVPRVVPTPMFSLGNDTSICFGSLTLTAPPGWQSYRWSTGDSTRSITVKKAGLYSVLTGSLGFSCPSGYGYINVSDKAIKLDLGKDTALCAGTVYPLHVPDSYTNILWTNGSHARDSLLRGGPPVIISASDNNGCYTDDTINVYYKYYPAALFGSDTTLCNDETLRLQLLPPESPFYQAAYLWNNNTTKDTFTVRQAGTYWGKVTFDGCTVSDTIMVSYVTGENFTLGKDTTICTGDSLQLRSSIGMASYLWSTGDTTESINVKQGGTYWLRVAKGSCVVMDTIRVSVHPKPTVYLGDDTVLCRKEILLLMPGSGNGEYLWQNGSADNNITVTGEGLYWLRYTENGCSVSDSIRVRFKELPAVQLGNDTGFCAGTTHLLNANNPTIQSYLWNDGSTGSSYTATGAGRYTVRVKGMNGCTNYDTIQLATVAVPVFDLGADTILCTGKTIPYSFGLQGASYAWDDGTTSGSKVIQSGGSHWLTVNQNGCSKTDSIVVTYKPTPAVNLGKDTTICEGTTTILNAANTNAIYRWNNGNNLATQVVTQPGLYFVEANINGCTASDSINIFYHPKPAFTLGRDTFLCSGQEINLQPVLNTTGTYTWQNGSSSSTFTVTDTGRYVLTVSNNCGSATSSITISKGVCQLYLPTAFSPNHDNLNDVFRVKYPFMVKEFRLIIYNRYGQKVFETTDIRKGWDGLLNGIEQPSGAYVWVVSMTDIDDRKKSLQGTVVMIR